MLPLSLFLSSLAPRYNRLQTKKFLLRKVSFPKSTDGWSKYMYFSCSNLVQGRLQLNQYPNSLLDPEENTTSKKKKKKNSRRNSFNFQCRVFRCVLQLCQWSKCFGHSSSAQCWHELDHYNHSLLLDQKKTDITKRHWELYFPTVSTKKERIV